MKQRIKVIGLLQVKVSHMSKKKQENSAEPSDPDGNLSGIDRYIRRLYKSLDFPCLDKDNGVFLKTKLGAVGREAVNERRYLHTTAVISKHLEKHFP
jgi:hypothetical protein